MNEDRNAKDDWKKLSGLGIELAGAVGGFALLGYLWDRHFGSTPWGFVIASGLGIIGGLYNVVRKTLQASKAAAETKGDADDR